MIQMMFDPAEAGMLYQILAGTITDLRTKIPGTEQVDFREHQKKREVLLKRLMEMVERETTSAS